MLRKKITERSFWVRHCRTFVAAISEKRLSPLGTTAAYAHTRGRVPLTPRSRASLSRGETSVMKRCASLDDGAGAQGPLSHPMNIQCLSRSRPMHYTL